MFDLRAPSSTDVHVLLLNQPIIIWLRPRKHETGIKDGFEEMKHKFPFGTFRSERQDYLFRCSVAPQVIDIDPRWTILDGTSERKT